MNYILFFIIIIIFIYVYLIGEYIPADDVIDFGLYDTYETIQDINSKEILYDINIYNIVFNQKSQSALLYFHGFGSHAEEFERFANTKQTISTYAYNTPGTSKSTHGYKNITLQEHMVYYNNIINYILSLSSKSVTIIANSTACLYIIWWIHRKYDSIKHKNVNLIFLSPNIDLPFFKSLWTKLSIYPIGKKIINASKNKIKYKNTTFDMYQFEHLIGILYLTRNFRYKLKEGPPLSLLYNKKDNIVSVSHIEEFWQYYPNKKIIKYIDEENVHNIIHNDKYFHIINELIDE